MRRRTGEPEAPFAMSADPEDRAQLLRSVLASVGQGIIVYDAELRVRIWNAFMEDLTGVTAAEAMGRPARSAFPLPGHRGALRLLQRALAGEVVRSPDFRFRRAPGQSTWVSALYSPQVDEDGGIIGVVAVITDITQRRHTERELRRSEARYRRLFQEARDAIYMTTRDGRFLDVNDAAVDMFGYARSELMAMNARDLYAEPADRLRFQEEVARRGSLRDWEVRLRRKDGRTLICLLTSTEQRDARGEALSYQGIIHDISERKAAEQQILHDALHDRLTGLPNRTLLADRANHLLRRAARRPAELFGVLLLDVDRFKYVNDSLGHAAGDDLLLALGRRIEGCVRHEDTVARLGGDEFGVLLDTVSEVTDATHVAERIQAALAKPFALGDHEVFVTASIGIALSAPGYTQADEMLRDADTAMNRAKLVGRARHELFETEMHTDVVARLRLETQLRRALERDELRLHYQPIVRLDTGKMAGFEALVRWQHPERGLLRPAEFIDMAEETGIIIPIGWWTLREACSQLRQWLQRIPGADRLTMNVNLSARQFLQPDLLPRVAAVLEETGVAPAALELEITESVFLESGEVAGAAVDELRRRGVRVCIDDFGMGYSSLGYLRRLSVDTVKIDRSFVAGLGSDGGNPELVQAIVALAHSLELGAIAEGVETTTQRQVVWELGAEKAQGHLFSTPIEADAATQLLEAGTGW
ncbi:MAG TPA: EAL domain-containing protein [Longimicrobiales bacterium]